jgi:hypothetical protein
MHANPPSADQGVPCRTCAKAGCEPGCPGLGPEDGTALPARTLSEWKEDQALSLPATVWAARALHLVAEVERLREALAAAAEHGHAERAARLALERELAEIRGREPG